MSRLPRHYGRRPGRQAGVVEKRTRFDDDSHGPRNHDLLLRAELPSRMNLIIGVEGKQKEFDLPLRRYREAALRRSPNTQALRRIDSLVSRWFETSLAADRDEPPLNCLGYQLFSALAATLADAKIHGSRRAVLLIMEYVTDLTDDVEKSSMCTTRECTIPFFTACSVQGSNERRRHLDGSLRSIRSAATMCGRRRARMSPSRS